MKKVKKLLSVLLVILMIMSVTPLSGVSDIIGVMASAENLSGTFGQNKFNWSLDTETGLLTISGTGQIPDDNSSWHYPWYDYKEFVKQIIIEEGVANIPYSFFSSEVNLESVTIPQTVEYIGKSAFYECSSLSEIIIPDSVKSIEGTAFSKCTSLKNIILSKNLETIGDGAFYNCTSIESLEIPDSVSNIDNSAFSSCTGLINIELPDSVVSLGSLAFTGCTNLKSIKLSDNLSALKGYTFQGCSSLEEVTIPENVTVIEGGTFVRCTSLKKVNFSDDAQLTRIGSAAFHSCTTLNDITLPEGLSVIGESAFFGCENLEKVTFPQSLKSINDKTFQSCYKLKNVIIPENVEKIGMYAFINTQESITFYSDTCEIYDDSSTINSGVKIYAPCGNSTAKDYAEKYKRTIETFHFEEILPEIPATCTNTGLTEGSYCSRCDEILSKQTVIEKASHSYTSQVVESTCTDGGYTVNTCSVCGDTNTSNFTNVLGHKSVVSKAAKSPAYKEAGWTEEISCSVCNTVLVQSKALSALNYKWEYDNNCHLYITGEGPIVYADTYGWEAFKDEIMYVENSDGITDIPENFFSGYPYLTEVYLDSNVTSIKENAFSNCPLLTAVTFSGNTAIGNDAFKGANEHLTFILDGNLPAPRSFAEQNGIRVVTTSYDNETKTLSFNGDITIQNFAEYKFLNNVLYNHADSEYIYFSKLIFADADSDFFIDDKYIDASISSDGLILNNVYVSIVLVSENGEQIVSFAKMLELLENGDYDAFKYKLVSDEKEEEGNLFTKFIKRALEFISKIINLIRKLFTKK